ncbi:hypothetical protein Tco_1070999 [Tanacetum coccineum]|uniref:Zinc finger PMZ-type domain-containing protein n=1 Tax=Tanacetum coccineum TaxID=301880 RepID=A0ABQ5HN26_9ASTR
MNPQIPIKAIQEQMQKKYHVSVSKHKAFRAKAQVHLRGDVKVQYFLLRDYANELQRCNPDTTVKIDVYGEEDHEKQQECSGESICLQKWVCMPIMVSIQLHMVLWNLRTNTLGHGSRKCLADDFDLFTNSNFTFITDRQKGLVPTIAKLFPFDEHRQLLDARDSPIITFLEFMRGYLMKRIVIVQKVIQKSDGPLTPTVTTLFNKIKESASECTIDWNGSDLFQVKGIPCKHDIAAINDMTDNGIGVGTLEDWVHESYKLQTWMNVYAHKINTVNGREMWSKFKCPTTLLPPKIAPQIGRPLKNRKKSKGEIEIVKDNKLTRKEPVGSETVASQTLRSQPVASQPVPRKPVPRKPVARKPIQNKSATNKRAASEINQPATEHKVVAQAIAENTPRRREDHTPFGVFVSGVEIPIPNGPRKRDTTARDTVLCLAGVKQEDEEEEEEGGKPSTSKIDNLTDTYVNDVERRKYHGSVKASPTPYLPPNGHYLRANEEAVIYRLTTSFTEKGIHLSQY